MKVRALGGIDAESMSSISEQVNNITDLPTQSLHGRKMKVINTWRFYQLIQVVQMRQIQMQIQMMDHVLR